MKKAEKYITVSGKVYKAVKKKGQDFK